MPKFVNQYLSRLSAPFVLRHRVEVHALKPYLRLFPFRLTPWLNLILPRCLPGLARRLNRLPPPPISDYGSFVLFPNRLSLRRVSAVSFSLEDFLLRF